MVDFILILKDLPDQAPSPSMAASRLLSPIEEDPHNLWVMDAAFGTRDFINLLKTTRRRFLIVQSTTNLGGLTRLGENLQLDHHRLFLNNEGIILTCFYGEVEDAATGNQIKNKIFSLTNAFRATPTPPCICPPKRYPHEFAKLLQGADLTSLQILADDVGRNPYSSSISILLYLLLI